MDFSEKEFREIQKSELIFKNVPDLGEVSRKIFEKENFSKGDIVLIDNDETLVPTLENLIMRKTFDVLPQDSQIFLETCKEKGVARAIVTNMPRVGHYMNHDNVVFGYEYESETRFLRAIEFSLNLCLGSLYKQTQKSLVKVAEWSMCNMSDRGRIAWIGNSPLDESFGFRLEKILREKGFKQNFYIYRLPWIRSFSKQ